jgi:hypothetical protein
MQDIKEYQEKFFVDFRLLKQVPQGNFYRRLKETLDLSYLRKMTAKYYGTEEQKSIDIDVFFKLMLIGYLENINSDRKIVEMAGMRMDMLHFFGYDIDELHYDKAYELLNTWQGKQKMRLRGATVEPVWETLLPFRGLKKVYTIGNELTNKQVLIASATYNLKKLLSFKTFKRAATIAIKATVADLKLKMSLTFELSYIYWYYKNQNLFI